MRHRTLWDKTWKDDRGKVVIWVTPNGWLIGWVALTFISLLMSGRASDFFAWLGSAALIIWCLLEIFKGVNYFRRALGLLVLIYAVATLIKSF